MITLTMRHHAGMPLKPMIDAVRKTNATLRCTKWGSTLVTPKKSFKAARSTEITHGPNGWHVHNHYLVFLPAELDAHDIDQLRHRMWENWDSTLRRYGYETSEKQTDATPLLKDEGIGRYLVKAGLEMSGGSTKHGRKQNSTPFQILGKIIDHTQHCHRQRHDNKSCPDYIRNRDIWHEYEQATHGLQQFHTPRGLADSLSVPRSILDDVIKDPKVITDDVLCIIGLENLVE
jgi:hypothetical protein